jgi:hypothetical protein
MDTYHAAHWSSDPSRLSSSEEEEECRYRNTHHKRTKQQGNGQQQRSQDSWTWERDLDYVITWEEIDRWSVDPGRVPEPAWDSLEQCEEGYRRMESARRHGRKPERQTQTKNVLGGGTRGVWRSQVGDLRQLPVLSGEREGDRAGTVLCGGAHSFPSACA